MTFNKPFKIENEEELASAFVPKLLADMGFPDKAERVNLLVQEGYAFPYLSFLAKILLEMRDTGSIRSFLHSSNKGLINIDNGVSIRLNSGMGNKNTPFVPDSALFLNPMIAIIDFFITACQVGVADEIRSMGLNFDLDEVLERVKAGEMLDLNEILFLGRTAQNGSLKRKNLTIASRINSIPFFSKLSEATIKGITKDEEPDLCHYVQLFQFLKLVDAKWNGSDEDREWITGVLTHSEEFADAFGMCKRLPVSNIVSQQRAVNVNSSQNTITVKVPTPNNPAVLSQVLVIAALMLFSSFERGSNNPGLLEKYEKETGTTGASAPHDAFQEWTTQFVSENRDVSTNINLVLEIFHLLNQTDPKTFVSGMTDIMQTVKIRTTSASSRKPDRKEQPAIWKPTITETSNPAVA